MYIVNFTAYAASQDQRELGVIDVDKEISHVIREKLSFPVAPTHSEMDKRAEELAVIAESLCHKYNADGVLVYAKTYFIHTLISALNKRGIKSYATDARKDVSIDQGNVRSHYKHSGLVCCVQ